MKQYIPPGGVDRVPPYDQRTGEHLWVILAAYKIDPVAITENAEASILDNENLIHLGSMGCFHCEAAYEKRLLMRRCPGGST